MFTVLAVGKDPLLDGVFAYGPYKSDRRWIIETYGPLPYPDAITGTTTNE